MRVGEIRDKLDLVRRQDRPGGVGRTVDDYGFGPGRESVLERFRRDSEIRIGIHENRYAAYQVDEMFVHYKVRVEDDRLITFIEQREKG